MNLKRSFLAVALSLTTIGATSAVSVPVQAEDTANLTLPQLAELVGRNGWKLPPQAVPGSTPERRAAWERLSPQEQQQKVTEVRELAQLLPDSLRQQIRAATQPSAPRSWSDVVASGTTSNKADASALVFTNSSDRSSTDDVIDAATNFSDPTDPGVDEAALIDKDGDSLIQDFEKNLANAFIPLYHISAGERPGTGFARFYDRIPQDVSTNLPANPPTVHYRVIPRGFTTDQSGQRVGVIQIDYLTLWNRDDGFDLGGICGLAVDFVESIIGSDLLIGSHYIDNERSAVLVAAPVPSGNKYNENVDAYGAYSYYVAAHEGNIFGDHSAYYDFYPPVPAKSHLHLWASRQKHASYTANPNGFPAIRGEWIALTYAAIDTLFWSGVIDEDTWLWYSFLADQAFFFCVVERFTDQGSVFPQTRINVGELSSPLNNSAFINDDTYGLRSKLATPLWIV